MAIQLTERAVTRINELKVKRQTPDHFFRIGVRGGGCSGLSYFVDFAEQADPKDKQFQFGEEQKVTVLIDRKSYLFLNGTEVDWKSELMKTGFEFKNPIAGKSCSCGESFSV
jgi:iron-sulfur cluster assembly protein